jgi:hypothetical protein
MKRTDPDRRLARRHADLLRRAASGELAATLAAGRRAERLATLVRIRARARAAV